MTKEEYYRLSDKIEADVNARIADQEHINKAHKKIKAAMTQMLGVQHMDSELTRVLRQLYTIEDVLYQYTTDTIIG